MFSIPFFSQSGASTVQFTVGPSLPKDERRDRLVNSLKYSEQERTSHLSLHTDEVSETLQRLEPHLPSQKEKLPEQTFRPIPSAGSEDQRHERLPSFSEFLSNVKQIPLDPVPEAAHPTKCGMQIRNETEEHREPTESYRHRHDDNPSSCNCSAESSRSTLRDCACKEHGIRSGDTTGSFDWADRQLPLSVLGAQENKLSSVLFSSVPSGRGQLDFSTDNPLHSCRHQTSRKRCSEHSDQGSDRNTLRALLANKYEDGNISYTRTMTATESVRGSYADRKTVVDYSSVPEACHPPNHCNCRHHDLHLHRVPEPPRKLSLFRPSFGLDRQTDPSFIPFKPFPLPRDSLTRNVPRLSQPPKLHVVPCECDVHLARSESGPAPAPLRTHPLPEPSPRSLPRCTCSHTVPAEMPSARTLLSLCHDASEDLASDMCSEAATSFPAHTGREGERDSSRSALSTDIPDSSMSRIEGGSVEPRPACTSSAGFDERSSLLGFPPNSWPNDASTWNLHVQLTYDPATRQACVQRYREKKMKVPKFLRPEGVRYKVRQRLAMQRSRNGGKFAKEDHSLKQDGNLSTSSSGTS